MIAKIDKQDWQ